MKIDIFTHVMLPRYKKALYRYADRFPTERAVQDRPPILTDSEARLEKLAPYPDLVQVLAPTMPPVEEVAPAHETADLARLCNDEMAETLAKHPDRYIAAVANVPLNDVGAALREAERAIKQLGFKGIQIHTRVLGKPLSSEELMPLYGLMTDFDLPIWIHPMRSSNQPDFESETVSHNQIFSIFGWPFDTTAAMARLVFAGIFERFPAIKLITHHCGGMIPYFADRLVVHYDNGLERLGTRYFPGLTKPPIEYFRMFYADTALDGGHLPSAAGSIFSGRIGFCSEPICRTTSRMEAAPFEIRSTRSSSWTFPRTTRRRYTKATRADCCASNRRSPKVLAARRRQKGSVQPCDVKLTIRPK